MSLVPYYDDSFLTRPHHRYLDDYFRAFDDQFIHPFEPKWIVPRWPVDVVEDLRNAEFTNARISLDKDCFQANIDVNQFRPHELSVKVSPDNTITVEGRHEEKRDKHGYISRHFVRKYALPDNCNVNQVQSELSSDGVLTITAPRRGSTTINYGPRITEVPVRLTGIPTRWFEEQRRKVREALRSLRSKI